MKSWHYIALGALIIFAVYGLYWYVQIRSFKMAGYESVLNTVPYSQSPSRPSARILVMGDSVSLGVGADTPEESIVGLLGQDNPTVEIVNDSTSGLKTHEILARMYAYEDNSFDLVFLHVGGNDVVDLVPVSETDRNMRRVLTEAKRISPNVMFATHGDFRTVTAIPWGMRWYWERRNTQQRELYHRLADEYGAALADYYREPGVVPQERIDVWYAEDNLHLSSEGQKDAYQMEVKPKFETFGL